MDVSFASESFSSLNSLQHCEHTRIKLDISIDLMNYNFFQKNNHLGMMSTTFVNQQQSLYPQVNTLAIIIKHFLKSNGLNKSYTGGMSTYTLVNIIVALIKHHRFSCETSLVTIF